MITLTTRELTLVSYELYDNTRRCYVRHAFCCNPNDADNRINKLDKQHGKMFKLMLRQDRTFIDV